MSPPETSGRRRGAKALLKGAFALGKSKKASSISQVPEPVMANYLENFGFAAEDARTWMDIPLDEVPEGLERSGAWVGIGIAEHYEKKGHTWYRLDCSLSQHGSKTVEWQVCRRLSQLRKLLHDPVKSDLGAEYQNVFKKVPFAHRGGRRGTSARLHRWCERLTSCINSGLTSPAVVALTLRFLEADRHRSGALGSGDCTAGSWRDERSTQCSEHGSSESPRLEDDDEGCSDESYESDFESDSASESDDEV